MTTLSVRRLSGLNLLPLSTGLTLMLPVFLLYARALADISVSLVGVLFLLHSAQTQDWRWLRRPWVWAASLIWALQLTGALLTGPVGSVLQSAAMIRLLILVAALESWVLVDETARNRLRLVMLVLAGWVALQCWEQLLTGSNIFGDRRWGDGALTGPFLKPRAGGVFLYLSLLGVLPVILQLLGGVLSRALAGAALLLAVVATMVIIGQRMPLLLLFLGLGLTALLVQKFRRPMLLAALFAAIALVALPLISPPAYQKLVIRFADQMQHFLTSPYGQLYGRALVMMLHHPLTGLGFDGFRNLCGDPGYAAAQMRLADFAIHDPSVDGCNMHPHNYFLQVGVGAGVTGLVLFVAMLGLWLVRLLRARVSDRSVGLTVLVVTFCITFWPIASSASLFTFDTAGWVFLTVGWALAAANPRP
jgi:O-antigen ligase